MIVHDWMFFLQLLSSLLIIICFFRRPAPERAASNQQPTVATTIRRKIPRLACIYINYLFVKEMSNYHLSLKPGETSSNIHNKFQSWNDSYNYYNRLERCTSPYRTDKMSSTEYNSENYGKSYGIVSTLRMKCKSQVIKNPAAGQPQTESNRRTMSHSMSSLSFQGPDVWGRLFDSSAETFKPCFEAHTIESKSLPEAEAEPFVLISDLPNVIKEALGDDIPVQIIDKFLALASKITRSDRIGFESFSGCIQPVLQSVWGDCHLRREYPALLKLMLKPRISDKNLLHLEDLSTSYRDAHCSLSRVRSGPTPLAESGAWNTFARDSSSQTVLAAGTTKGSCHPPGYTGHVPANLRLPKKREHGLGAHVHPTDNHLALTQEGMNSMKGYTGYTPKYMVAKERTTSCDPRTATGFFFGKPRSMI